MSISNAAGNAAALRDSTAVRADRSETVTGWDPVEVWRTRVLAPRLTEQALANREPAAGKPRLVRST